MHPELYILGSSSATPTRDRHPSAQLFRIENEKILIDCGEGTQSQMIKYGLRNTGINHILISHLHGDHYFGLIGLISTMNLMGRVAPLKIVCPPPLQEILESMIRHGGMQMRFDLEYVFTSMDGPQTLVEHPLFTIEGFPLQHRIHCNGFVIRETPGLRHINVEAVKSFDIPVEFYSRLKTGEDFIMASGERIANGLLTTDPSPAISYAYCSDTIYDPGIAEHFKGCDMLYHEATYMKNLEDRANLYFHSTAEQAAKIAKLAGASQLLLGHFSSRYDHLKPLLLEAKEVFPNTKLAIEGEKFIVRRVKEETA